MAIQTKFLAEAVADRKTSLQVTLTMLQQQRDVYVAQLATAQARVDTAAENLATIDRQITTYIAAMKDATDTDAFLKDPATVALINKAIP